MLPSTLTSVDMETPSTLVLSSTPTSSSTPIKETTTTAPETTSTEPPSSSTTPVQTTTITAPETTSTEPPSSSTTPVQTTTTTAPETTSTEPPSSSTTPVQTTTTTTPETTSTEPPSSSTTPVQTTTTTVPCDCSLSYIDRVVYPFTTEWWENKRDIIIQSYDSPRRTAFSFVSTFDIGTCTAILTCIYTSEGGISNLNATLFIGLSDGSSIDLPFYNVPTGLEIWPEINCEGNKWSYNNKEIIASGCVTVRPII